MEIVFWSNKCSLCEHKIPTNLKLLNGSVGKPSFLCLEFVLHWFSVMLFSDAYETAKMVCEQYYSAAPELKIEEFNGTCPYSLTKLNL